MGDQLLGRSAGAEPNITALDFALLWCTLAVPLTVAFNDGPTLSGFSLSFLIATCP